MTGQSPIEIDTSRPHPARMYDWYLGGKDNYPVGEAMGRQMLALDPRVPVMAQVNRAFMHRATRWLAGQGVRQFLDVGTGIPTEPNLSATEKLRAAGVTLALRSRTEFARFFDGLDLVEPGVEVVDKWHPELGEPVPGQEDGVIPGYGAVGRTS